MILVVVIEPHNKSNSIVVARKNSLTRSVLDKRMIMISFLYYFDPRLLFFFGSNHTRQHSRDDQCWSLVVAANNQMPLLLLLLISWWRELNICGIRQVAREESRNETIRYTTEQKLGQPLANKLFTLGNRQSSTRMFEAKVDLKLKRSGNNNHMRELAIIMIARS